MGLAASHARLCMLTRRKADVEARLMRVSNAKMALARDSERVSKEYTKALNATSLVYNTGTKDVPLTYSLIMSPTTQCMLTNSSGAVVLDNTLWTALGSPASGARPTDALGFINKMTNANPPYTSLSGFASANTGSTGNAGKVDLSNLPGYSDSELIGQLPKTTKFTDVYEVRKDRDGSVNYDNPFCFYTAGDGNADVPLNQGKVWNALAGNSNAVTGSGFSLDRSSILGQIINDTETILKDKYKGTDLSAAFDTAERQTIAFYYNQCDPKNIKKTQYYTSTDGNFDDYNKLTIGNTRGYNQIVNESTGPDDLIIDPQQVALTFLRYFEAACKGLPPQTVTDKISPSKPHTSGDASHGTTFTGMTDGSRSTSSQPPPPPGSPAAAPPPKGASGGASTPASGASAPAAPAGSNTTPTGAALYYYNLFNAICDRGWVKDNDVDNQDYMQGMIQYGGYGVKQYQNGTWTELSQNSPDSPISATTSDETRDKAKAAYDAEKDKIKAKEVEWDVEQTAADTERAAIVADMDSVKKILDKNMDAFKLFQNG